MAAGGLKFTIYGFDTDLPQRTVLKRRRLRACCALSCGRTVLEVFENVKNDLRRHGHILSGDAGAEPRCDAFPQGRPMVFFLLLKAVCVPLTLVKPPPPLPPPPSATVPGSNAARKRACCLGWRGRSTSSGSRCTHGISDDLDVHYLLHITCRVRQGRAATAAARMQQGVSQQAPPRTVGRTCTRCIF